jgi:Domain of unknown function (DUF4168)
MMIRYLCFFTLLGSSQASPPSLLRWLHQSRGGSLEGAGAFVEDENGRSQILSRGSDQMPCLFGPEEAQYDRYAACLAATEGLRRLREKAAFKKSRFFKKGDETEDEKRANAEFVLHSGNIVESLGMSVAQFNQLGRKVMEDSKLKEKVSHIQRCKHLAGLTI